MAPAAAGPSSLPLDKIDVPLVAPKQTNLCPGHPTSLSLPPIRPRPQIRTHASSSIPQAPKPTLSRPTSTAYKPIAAEPFSFKRTIIFPVWDWLWRQWYNLIATWGISVMEPWERVFTLILFASLAALFGVALVKLPGYTRYAASRMAYYLFGASRQSVASQVFEVGTKAESASLPAVGAMDWCQMALQKGWIGNVTDRAAEAAAGMGLNSAKIDAVGWAQSS